jgi:hypothetical protein
MNDAPYSLTTPVRFLGMRGHRTSHQLPEPTTEDLARISGLLREIGGQHVVWGAAQSLEVWALEQRALLDQRMSDRLRFASWALVVATLGLVGCTGGLIWATLTS